MNNWVSISVACDLTGVSRRTIYTWLGQGKLHWQKTAGNCVRIYAPSLWAGYDGERTPWVPNANHHSRTKPVAPRLTYEPANQTGKSESIQPLRMHNVRTGGS